MIYINETAVAPVQTVGTVPSGTLNITENGIYDVTNYANVNVIIGTNESENEINNNNE